MIRSPSRGRSFGLPGSPEGPSAWPARCIRLAHAAGEEAPFNNYTLSFYHIPDIKSKLSYINDIDIELIHQQIIYLTY